MTDKRLTGWEHRALRTALEAAFTAAELRMCVKENLDVDVANVLNTAVPFDELTFELVAWADRRGNLLQLFQAASEERPGNNTLKRAVAVVFHSDERYVQLQAIVNARGVGVDFLDPAQWREAFAKSELAVCRLENGAGRPWGTGWLVANDLIITNRHVWGDALKDGRAEVDARAAFNYRVLLGGGEAYANRVGFVLPDPVVAESPVEELDFVLLRLNRNVGGTPVAAYPGAPTIAPLAPKNFAFVGSEQAIILQHPNGAPLKMAWGLVAEPVAQTLPQRVVYLVNTEPGSSGSPVFLTDWHPVALHAQAHSDQANAGVPMSLILPIIEPFIT